MLLIPGLRLPLTKGLQIFYTAKVRTIMDKKKGKTRIVHRDFPILFSKRNVNNMNNFGQKYLEINNSYF